MPKASSGGSSPIPTAPPTQRSEGFVERYANNFRFESTVYDLKIIFGQTDLATGNEISKQHSSITLPWPAVKVLEFMLQTQLVFQETQSGRVVIPPSQLPQHLPSPPPDSDPSLVDAVKQVNQLFDEFRAREMKGTS